MSVRRLQCWAFNDAASARRAATAVASNAEVLCLETCMRRELFVFGAVVPDEGRLVADGVDAAERLFAIAAGVLSNVPGERAVAHQLRMAMKRSERNGWIGRRLRKLAREALKAGDHLRARVHESTTILELPDLVADQLRASEECRADRGVLVLGGGALADAIARALDGAGILVTCRAARRARGQIIDLDQVRPTTRNFGLIVSALSAGGLFDRADFHPEALVVDVSSPASITGADLPLNRIVEGASERLRAQAEAVERAAHRLPSLAAAALACAVSPSIARQGSTISQFREAIVEAELRRLAPVLAGLSEADAEKIRRSIRHTAARSVHPLHDYVNQLGRQGRSDEAQAVVDHLLGVRFGFDASTNPAPEVRADASLRIDHDRLS